MNSLAAPILSRADLISRVAAERTAGRTIILANGCFDLIHAGHIRYLNGAKELGGFLVVGLNSDRQVQHLKGSGRPFILEAERAEIIAALRCVDVVTVFDEPTVDNLIDDIRPDVHAKGTDYTVDTVPERERVLGYGGRVAIVGDPKDHSSTNLIKVISESN
ncbi:MAG: D-glycero-beta-D-manno-heptose 1-phosphate adenylyltransferase [Acidobacteria bacterium]|nr:MAG: D-glycero-beta-D-manno-heptose 1-phosphate adenylyltransferase [Acidobacteriota bacterium]